MKQIIILVALLLLLPLSHVLAGQFCKADCNGDCKVDLTDLVTMKSEFNKPDCEACSPPYPAPVEKTGQTTCYDMGCYLKDTPCDPGCGTSDCYKAFNPCNYGDANCYRLSAPCQPTQICSACYEMVEPCVFNIIDCTGTGHDGENQSGVASPEPRFTDNGNGTVTDNLSGLMWTKNSDVAGLVFWQGAFDYVAGMNQGTHDNYGCTDWRVPNVKELISLIDYNERYPALPPGHPFNNEVSSNYHWTSNTDRSNTSKAWYVFSNEGGMISLPKSTHMRWLWPVRGPE